MKRDDLEKNINTSESDTSRFVIDNSGIVFTPYPDKKTRVNDGRACVCFYANMRDKTTPLASFTVALTFADGMYDLRCSDLFLEGRLNKQSVNTMVDKAISRLSPVIKRPVAQHMKKSFKIVPESTACEEKTGSILPSKSFCEHEQALLATLDSEILNEMEFLYDSLKNGIFDYADDGMDLSSFFKKYAFKKHLLLEGEKGSGKTFYVNQWCKKYKMNQVFIGGHEQFESIDFLGHYIPTEEGTLAWKDGALTQAFRDAAAGKRTVLVIDEMLRIPKRELNILVSALIPWDGYYVLRTGRALESVDGIAKEEMIKAPANLIWVLGTTNIGAGYAVEEIDEALIDRFRPVRKDTSRSELEKILSFHIKKRGYSYSAMLRLVRFYSQMKLLKMRQEIAKIVNIRHLSEAIQFSKSEDDIRSVIEDTVLVWVERNYEGYPDGDQIELIHKVIEQVWGEK